MKTNYKLKSKITVYPGMGGWRFLTLPKKEAEMIKKDFGGHAKGWGSIPVSVTIGQTTWKTSIFPDRKLGTYLLPLKAAVRKSEKINDNSIVNFDLNILLAELIL